jgi:hypothetical protein
MSEDSGLRNRKGAARTDEENDEVAVLPLSEVASEPAAAPLSLKQLLADKSLSIEQKKKLIQEYQQNRRAEVEKQEAADAARRERERLEQNRSMMDLQRSLADRDELRAIEKQNREKAAAKQRHRVIMAKLELAKRERAERNANSSSEVNAAQAAAPSPVSNQTLVDLWSRSAVADSNCATSVLRIRLSNGKLRSLTCSPGDTLQSIVDRLVADNEPDAELSRVFMLHVNFPRLELGESKASSSLLELKLFPSGNLIVMPSDHPDAFSNPRADATLQPTAQQQSSWFRRVFCCSRRKTNQPDIDPEQAGAGALLPVRFCVILNSTTLPI